MSALSAALLVLQTSASSLAHAEPGEGFTVPSESVIEQCRRHHSKRHWLRVTTDATRHEVRVGRIDSGGLKDLVARRDAPPPPPVIEWSSIARIDHRISQFRRGQITGLLIGGALGATGGAWLGSSIKRIERYESNGQNYEIGHSRSQIGAWTGLIAGSVAGAWLWGRVGDRNVTERVVYVAPEALHSGSVAADVGAHDRQPSDRETSKDTSATPSPPTSPPTPATSPPSGHTPSPVSEDETRVPPAPRSASSSRAIDRASARIRSENLLQILGDFGRFQGFASRVGPDGLEGLRADLRNASTLSAKVPDPLRWDRIASIEKRGSSAGRGALTGGMTLGLAGAGLAFLVVTGFGGGETDAGGAAVQAGFVTGGIGAVIGGLIGAAVPRWHLVYGQR